MREKVFSLPQVIRRVNADFIPLALNAVLVNQVEPAGDENESRVYARIRRSKAAPQGVCVLNSGGQVLDWVLMFRSEADIVSFLDRSLEHYRENPDGGRAVTTRRFQQYPGNAQQDYTDTDTASITALHAPGKLCGARAIRKSRGPEGAMVARLVGRVLDEAGNLHPDTVNQEHYAQDYFTVSAELQKRVVGSLGKSAGTVPLPREFGSLLATYAYLGHIDVRPLDNPGGEPGQLKACDFTAQRVSEGLWRVRGKTETLGTRPATGPGRHEVKLTWEGFLEADGARITRLLLSARGTERLSYGEKSRTGNEVAFLPAGRFIDLEAGVRYGIVGEPVAPGEGVASSNPGTQVDPSQDEAAQRIQGKIQKLQEGVQKWQNEGKDLSPIAQIMKEFEPLMQSGKVAEAEEVLDKALKALEGSGKPAPSEGAGSLEKVAGGFKMAEGPAWDGEHLYFTDVPPSQVHKLGADGKTTVVRSNTRWGAGLAFDSKRRLIICEAMGRRVTRVENDGTEKALAQTYEGKKLNGPNDLAVDARDGIYFTDPLFMNQDKREQDKEAVYYIAPDGTLTRVADDLAKPNGIALDAKGKTLFIADTSRSKVRAYPVKEDGTLGEGRDFGSVSGPDGVRVDPDGRVYAAGRTGIAVWDASGKRLGTLKVPAPATSLAFGDTDRRTMYITTAPALYKVRLDPALKLLSSEDPATTKEPPPANPEETAQRIQGKIQKLQEGIQKWQSEGKDPSPIGQIMQEFGPLIESGKLKEAEAILDKALKALEGSDPDK
jgi:gluconolactonase